jgi:hypothetical protein
LGLLCSLDAIHLEVAATAAGRHGEEGDEQRREQDAYARGSSFHQIILGR